jgi:hypothetical protein
MKINPLKPFVWALFVLSGCVGDAPAPALETQVQAAEPAECAKTENDFIRLKLAKNCVACHGEGAVAPYFASAEAFEGLLVQNPRLVIPGDPDGSELVKLLEGNGTGAFSQMPTSGPNFAAIPEADRDISIQEIRDWITGLQLGAQDINPDREAPTTRRIGADELRNSLMSQLGLSFEDDFVQQLSSNFESPTLVLRGPPAASTHRRCAGFALWRPEGINQPTMVSFRRRRLASTKTTHLRYLTKFFANRDAGLAGLV